MGKLRVSPSSSACCSAAFFPPAALQKPDPQVENIAYGFSRSQPLHKWAVCLFCQALFFITGRAEFMPHNKEFARFAGHGSQPALRITGACPLC